MARNRCHIHNLYWFSASGAPPISPCETFDLTITETDYTTPIVINYGNLYNWYAITDVRSIAATGWKVPTWEEVKALGAYLGTDDGSFRYTNAGGKLKETGYTYWASPNTGATNEVGFNGRGVGFRFEDGSYVNRTFTLTIPTITQIDATFFRVCNLNRNDAYMWYGGGYNLNSAHPVRLLKSSTSLSHGQTGYYTGNDGKVYNTICIGTQEWIATSLVETQYSNGDPIPTVANSTTWSGLTTGAKCAYNNDENNV